MLGRVADLYTLPDRLHHELPHGASSPASGSSAAD